MELIEYIRIFRRWFWLIFLAAFVAGGVGYIARSSQQPVYEAKTQIIIGSILQNPDPDSVDINAPVDLTATYSQIVRTNDVQQATIDALNLPMSVGELRSIISTSTVAGTSLLIIVVKYEDPILAADIANELATQLILASPTNLTPEQTAQVAIANDQIITLTEQLDVIQAQMKQIDTQLEELDADDSEERTRLEEQRILLLDQLNQAIANIAKFADTIARYQQRTGALDVIETATIPINPVGTSSITSMILSAMVGGMLAAGVALLSEYLNDTLRSVDEVAQLLAVPIVGVISRFGEAGASYQEKLINNPDLMFSRTAEEYRSLRTNLMFSDSENSPQVFVITSPGALDGKSLTAANLAISIATTDLRVLLIDADLRRPRLHTIFGLNNDIGLTTLLPSTPHEVGLDNIKDNTWKQCLIDPGIPNLRIITSGFMPHNPTELLGSVALKSWINVFRRDLDVDVILFDTPPCLIVADSLVLSATVGVQTILVINAEQTRQGAALKAKERFTNLDMSISGVIFNNANPRDESYYGYSYYSYYYRPDQENGEE